MNSTISKELNLDLHPVVILKSDQKPQEAKQAKAGVYYCIMSLFAQSVVKGKTIVFDRDTYGCPGAYAGLGFGNMYDKAMGGFDTFSAFFAKGLVDANNKEVYQAIVDKVNPHLREKLIDGERFHCSQEKAYRWISEDLPIFNFTEKYRIIKPLLQLQEDEIPESVIFTVNAIQLTALITLMGSITEGICETVTPQGAACQMMGNIVFDQAQKEHPKAVLGLIDLAARQSIRKMLPDSVLTYAIPWKLFLDLEEEAKEGVFKSPIWKNLQ